MISENMSREKEFEEVNNIENISSDDDIDEDDEEYDEEDEDDEEEEDEEDDIEETNDKNMVDEPLKKKRGRKSKPKEDIPEEKIQKKRGRKPKVKEIETVEKIPKKRGRKPKEKIYSVKELPKTFFEENKNETFILHLPIKMSDRENNTDPQPIMNDNLNYSMLDNNNQKNKMDNNMLMTQHDLLDNLVFDNEHDEDEFEKVENRIEKQRMQIQSFKKEKDNEKDEDDENKPNKIIKKNLRNIMYEFINSNADKTWPDSTNTYCWWCCHPFHGVPCALPELYRKEKFFVSGCFCSFNCTASYNFSKNDDSMWERYSLLNLMYKKLYNQKFVKISLAPPREILKIFGGYMSIDEFRDNSLKNEKVFTVVKPPLISIIPKIEENISSANKSVKNNILNVNENILNKTQNNLKLKRNKPITNPNSTLQSFMDLKII